MTTRPREKCATVPTKVRKVVYPVRKGMVNTVYGPKEVVIDQGGYGIEIVEEVRVCQACVEAGMSSPVVVG